MTEKLTAGGASLSQTVDEINVHCEKQDKNLYIKYYLSTAERKELITELGDAACLLFEYYLRMASIPNPEISDQRAAAYFGWSTRKAQRYRQALQREGWFDLAKYNISRNRKGVSYYIGKKAVQQFRSQS